MEEVCLELGEQDYSRSGAQGLRLPQRAERLGGPGGGGGAEGSLGSLGGVLMVYGRQCRAGPDWWWLGAGGQV